ncbi:MAG TPA: galactose oxidase-like domain-containing protein [Anaerolineales bacterium]|nr:galactose oxidase-like domain-containing protein [Anaerolineales bacterium]
MRHDGHDSPPQTEGPPEVAGKWEMITAEFKNSATHVALLPTNKIFIFGGSSLDRDEFNNPTLPRAEILDMNTNPWQTCLLDCEPIKGDIWCGGHTFLPDGKLLFVGGTNYYPPPPDPFYGGLKEAYLFDPFTETWERLDDMQVGRWYPTLIRLADDRVLTFSGLEYRLPSDSPKKNILKILYELIAKIDERIARVHEVFDPVTKKWSPMKVEQKMPLYPRMHLLPDGDVFYSGMFNTHFFTPGRFPSARLRPQTLAWTEVGGRHFKKNREEGISVLLALRPPDYKPQVLIAGGGTHNLGRILMILLHSIGKDSWSSIFHFLTHVQDTVERIDLSRPNPRWELAGKMHQRRVHANGVLLPDGNVLVVGGMSSYGHISHEHGVPGAVLEAEMYDPSKNTWTRMAAQKKARVYHSTAILLPDGRVISMGSNPASKMIEKSIEVFSPPYLFRGERPLITEYPEQIEHGQPFSVTVDKARQIGSVVLMSPEVLTHVTNTDQRLLELKFSPANGERLEIQGPPTPAHMPRGYCLLFVLDQAGVPSIGKFLKIG